MSNPLAELRSILADERADAERVDRATRRLEHTRHVRGKLEREVIADIERELRARFDVELLPHLPEGCVLEVFESCNGEPHWVTPVAAQVDHPTDRTVDGYGLCDAAADDYGPQADYLLDQLREGLARYLPQD